MVYSLHGGVPGPFVRMAPNEVSITHPSGVKALLLATLPKGDWYRIVCFPDYRFTTPFSMIDPKEKNECSKYLSSGYLQHNVIRSEPALDKDIAQLLGWMNKYSDEGKPMELDKFFTYVAFDITGEVVFSKPFGFIEKGEDVSGSIAMNMGMEIYIAFAGYFQWLHRVFANPFTTWLAILPMGHLFDTTITALNERQKDPDASNDLSAHWFKGLEKAKQDKSKYFNLRCLQAFATANVGAGSDTVSAGLQSFVYYLLRHPDGWSKVATEIDDARKQGRCEGEVISYADAAQLPYLQAAIKEGLRMFAPISMGLPRVAPKGGLKIGEMYFPEGVTLTVSPSVTHLSKNLWGPDAQEFRPERWLEPDANTKEKYFIPWGAGYASCPGQHIAKIQLLKITATIVRDFKIRQVNPEQEWQWAAYFTAVPHDWPVYITKRSVP
ncbi:cytochrome P450 [Pestalotiopsis sp. NC0098]|nr:cytochrome P450 [Pestalotiopsis sp. NC0098]